MKAGGENDNQNFVVQSLTTANQRAASKSSAGSAHSFIQKLTTTQKAGVQIAHGTTITSASTNAMHGSAQAVMSAYSRDSSHMTAKQAEFHNLRMRSQENRYPPTSFLEQQKQLNPELENAVSEFSLGSAKE